MRSTCARTSTTKRPAETGFDMRDVAGSETVTNENELLNDYTIKDADAGFDDPSVLEDDNSAAAESASDEVNIDE